MSEISIIIPVYNAETYLSECLDSLICQTFEDIEILCIDDGSADKSRDILKQYAFKDSRIKIFSQPHSGPAHARNLGLKNADSPFLMFCDADDFYEPNMCEEMLNTMKNYDVDMVICDTEVIETEENHGRTPGNIEYCRLKYKGYGKLNSDLRKGMNILLWNKILKTDLVRKWQIDFPGGYKSDDDAFMMQYLAVANTFFGLDKKLYHYRLLNNSVMGQIYAQGKTSALFDKIGSTGYVLDFLSRNHLLNDNLWIVSKVKSTALYPLNYLSVPDSVRYLKKMHDELLGCLDVKLIKQYQVLQDCMDEKYEKIIKEYCKAGKSGASRNGKRSIVTNAIMRLTKLFLRCRYRLLSLRKPLKIGFLRLHNEENTVIACLMSVVDMLDKIVLIHSDITDSSLKLVGDYIKANSLENKILIFRYPYHVYPQNAGEYKKEFEWKNSLAAYYQFGYEICRKIGRFRNGYIAKIDADQVYMNNCFQKIEKEMIEEKYVLIINSYGGYNGYADTKDKTYALLERPQLGCLNGSAGDHLCIPLGLASKVNFTMEITADHAWEVMDMPHKYYRFKRNYDQVMWFHFNHKKVSEGVLKPLSEQQYEEYRQKILPLLIQSNSDYVHLKVQKNVDDQKL